MYTGLYEKIKKRESSMNPTIKKMLQHVSVRDFQDQPLDFETKEKLLLAAQSGSTSNFVQAYSIIEITDRKLRAELADITSSASYVNKTGTFYVFVADLYRQSVMLEKKGMSLAGIKNMEELLVATVDTTIAAEDMAVAAQSMDLGICYIGGIRNDIYKVAELLKLPKYTFPLFGMTIGVPNKKNQLKPRMPLKNQVSTNAYDTEMFTQIGEYDELVEKYYASRDDNSQAANWTDKNIDFFREVRRHEVADFLKEQGFTLR